LTFHHTELQFTTLIVVLEVKGLYQSIWGTMECYFGLEITEPLLYH
jgi:hypothetical protein